MTIAKASEQELKSFLDRHSAWSISQDKLHREFVFGNFVQAFGFMTQAALYAEKSDHHPEWFNVYKKVIVDLTTHEADGITERDFSLAEKMEEIANNKLK
jgi:4a-hydroxytetrahydrobiopterin dehydratase